MLLGFANIEEERQEELRKRKLLEDALEQARHAADAKSSFLSNMSHDIRTPMNAIMGFAGIASEHLDDPDKVRACLDKIIVSSNHLLQLINNVLDMSRIESGRMVLEESWVNIREIVHEVSDFMTTVGRRGNRGAPGIFCPGIRDQRHRDRNEQGFSDSPVRAL